MSEVKHQDGNGSVKTRKLLQSAGRRPQFHALWHLIQLDVIEDTKTFASCKWRAVSENVKEHPERRVKVAIIDTLPAFNHPNLCDAIDLGALRDFTDPNNPKTYNELPDADFRSMTFGAHGTAVAGLIAARPRRNIDLQNPKDFVSKGGDNSSLNQNLPGAEKIALPYCGINPFAEIVPLVVSSAPDPAMILKALNYAICLAEAPAGAP